MFMTYNSIVCSKYHKMYIYVEASVAVRIIHLISLPKHYPICPVIIFYHSVSFVVLKSFQTYFKDLCTISMLLNKQELSSLDSKFCASMFKLHTPSTENNLFNFYILKQKRLFALSLTFSINL